MEEDGRPSEAALPAATVLASASECAFRVVVATCFDSECVIRTFLHLLGTGVVFVGTLFLPWFVDVNLCLAPPEGCGIQDLFVQDQAENLFWLLGVLGVSGAILGVSGSSRLIPPRVAGLLLTILGGALALYTVILVQGLSNEPEFIVGDAYVSGGTLGAGGPVALAGFVVWTLIGLSLLVAPPKGPPRLAVGRT